MEEQIIAFYRQLVRPKERTIAHFKDKDSSNTSMEDTLNTLLSTLKRDYSNEKNLFYVTLLYKLMAYTRDIHYGMGERWMTYVQLYTWFKYFPELAKYMILRMVYYTEDFSYHDFTYGIRDVVYNDNFSSENAFGSWRDMKELCHFCLSRDTETARSLFEFVVQLMGNQLFLDHANRKEGKRVSMVAKWFPRENKANRLVHRRMLEVLFPCLLFEPYSKSMYSRKARQLRKIVAALNIYLDTVEIKMCKRDWCEIAWNKIPIHALYKYKDRFLKPDLQSTFKRGLHSKNVSRGSTIDLYRLVKDAIQYKDNLDVCCLIQHEWEVKKRQLREKKCMRSLLPLLDVSYSMSVENNVPLYSALGIAIAASEMKHEFKDRIVTFSNTWNWVNLSSCSSFVEKVNFILDYIHYGGHSCFDTVFERLVKLVHQDIPEKSPPFDLLLLSDMSFSSKEKSIYMKMKETIKDVYGEKKIPFSRFIFWTMRNNETLPCKYFDQDTILVSGYHLFPLSNLFHRENTGHIETPYTTLIEMLNKERYVSLEKRVVLHSIFHT